ncbi:hypothetical protein F5141DRAFT_359261 [Pisolithus sp. B1]|nr:hypothetical protein F5141DRAFT_359261 [Pisolithus sp. B1]
MGFKARRSIAWMSTRLCPPVHTRLCFLRIPILAHPLWPLFPSKRKNSNLRRRLPKPSGAVGTSRSRKEAPYQRNKKQVRLLPVVESFAQKTLLTPTMMTQTSISRLPLVPSSAVSAGHLEMPPTACEAIEEDYSDFLDYTITISPDPHSSSQYSSTNSSAGYQTFPETPMFSPSLFSPDRRRPPAPSLRTRRPPLPRSATLPSPREYAARETLPRPTSIEMNFGPHEDHGDVRSRRPQSIASPIHATPSFSLDPPSGNSHNSLPRCDNALPTTSLKDALPSTDTTGPSEEPVDSDTPAQTVGVDEASLTSSSRKQDSGSVVLAPSTASIPSACRTGARQSPTSVPLPESTDVSPRLPSSSDSLSRTLSPVPSARRSSSQSGLSPTMCQPQSVRDIEVLPPGLGRPSLPSITPIPFQPVPSGPTPSRRHSLVAASPSARPSSTPISASCVAVPPHRAVTSEGPEDVAIPPTDVDHPILRMSSSPAAEGDGGSSLPNSQPQSFGSQTRVRSRPPLPIGPRRPSGPSHPFDSRVSGPRARGSSESKMTSGETCRNTDASTWKKLYEVASQPLPRFQTPPLKWRGLTMEAAQWTLTSAELHGIVSRAMKQFSEGSSIRLLRLETLDGEIAEEIHRLEMLHTDVKSRYKMLVRRRWQLLGELTGHLESGVVGHTASIAMAELAEVTLAQDQLTDELHTVAGQLAQLEGLRDVHHSSALAMALRKVNTIFLRQAAEMQKLREQLESLEAERDEGWKQAHDIAVECDRLMETAGEPSSKAPNKRSERVSAVRKSSIRQSKAGLRSTSASLRRSASSVRSRGSMSIPSSACKEDIPPVPSLPLRQQGLATSAAASASGSSRYSGASSAMALAQAQQELYDMLGLNFQNTPASSKLPDSMRSLTNNRPLSGPDLRARRAHENKAIRSVILDDRISTPTTLGMTAD